MKSLLSTVLLSLAATLGAVNSVHAQRTINDCESIQAADAYNQCLAKFGPPAKTLNVEGQRPGDVKSGSEEAAKGAGTPSLGKGTRFSRHGRGRSVVRRGRGGHVGRTSRGGRQSGRKRMSISVGR